MVPFQGLLKGAYKGSIIVGLYIRGLHNYLYLFFGGGPFYNYSTKGPKQFSNYPVPDIKRV